jgi:hypothetical protein
MAPRDPNFPSVLLPKDKNPEPIDWATVSEES